MQPLSVAIPPRPSFVPLFDSGERTFGMAAWPLNLLRTRLSIPFGFLQFGATHLKRSLWWRLKRAVRFFTMGTCFFAAAICALDFSHRKV